MISEKDHLELLLNGVMGNERISPQAAVHIRRPVYQIDELNEMTTYEYQPKKLQNVIKGRVESCSIKSFIKDTIPIVKWLPKYNCKKNILGDIISGLTIAVMHIPQGMGYALLGNLPPITGIYMAFFPVLIYCLFGTSRHVSMGTFAVICLMTGKTVSQYSSEEILVNGTSIIHDVGNGHERYTNIQVATTVTFAVAIIQVLMYIFRLGIIATLLSETLVNAFTCASAFHVASSQLKDLFGLPIGKRKGMFKILKTVYDACLALPNANISAVILSSIFIMGMVLNNEVFKPWLSKRTKIPFPIELVAVTVGTSISYILNMNEVYKTSVVGPVPTGLPYPALPEFSLIPTVALDALVITMVSYTITMSMALIFAQKLHYEVDANQELFALGASNCVGSFFSCMPITASLSRSMIQEAVGGVTQIASIVSCGILLTVLLWIGPVFEFLPRSVLASIIVVALKSMLLQFMSLGRYWKLSKWDALVWIATFFSTTILDIDIGLLIGILVSLFSIFIQGQQAYSCLKGIVPDTDLYLDLKRYKATQEIDGLKIFHYSGSISFASKANFKGSLFKKTGLNPLKALMKKEEYKERATGPFASVEEDEMLIKCIILDFGALTYIDPSGVEMLRELMKNYKQLDIEMYISACSGPVFETLKRCDRYDGKDSKFIIFPTIHDAVLYAEATILKDKII